ncbi:MAG: hypothetical protein AVDCRST_MAG83-3284 [uncultured Arthrobacter sp.]|uniref:Helix-turn-helix domain-containing protein n=1 Tax=uncultured Arthrobacter sp. TaxID=114050 RepID=A0A6J4J729_9MICC|nr:helix-turn-helix domain-containing protein [uncultured Arthrobacter sp.]CAA9271284.1 MAG: hypothetical protein AVDCRST_MAG83-3284 [uncultured Arthrobacter sp.]
MTTEKILLSPREVAAHFGLSIRQLARWRRAGTGPPWYALTPRTTRYDPADVSAWLSGPTAAQPLQKKNDPPSSAPGEQPRHHPTDDRGRLAADVGQPVRSRTDFQAYRLDGRQKT